MDEKLKNEIAEAFDEAEPEVKTQEELQDLKEVVYILMHNKYLHKNVTCKNGKTKNIARIPQGTKVKGKDISGFAFFPPYVDDSKYVKECSILWYHKSFDITLVKGDERVVVTPQELSDAINESFREYKKAREQEKGQGKEEKKTLDSKLSEAKENVEKQEMPKAAEEKRQEASL